MQLASIPNFEEPCGAQEINSKRSWQAGERVHDEEAEISQRKVLRVVLMMENPNGCDLGHLADVLKRLSISYDVLVQKTRSCFGNVICKI